MKKVFAVAIAIMLATLLLASCGASGAGSPMDGVYRLTSSAGGGTSNSAPAPAAAPPPMADMDMGDYNEVMQYEMIKDVYATEPGEAAYASVGGTAPVVPVVSKGLSEKIIYSVYANVETVKFDETIESVYELLSAYGGFIENSYIGGKDYAQYRYGWQTYRSADFTLRVPVDRLNEITASLDVLGNVKSLRSDSQNITTQFFDTQSRLNSYTTQEERLLSMLAKAETVPDLIAIEERLADVRYQIESLTTTLRNWQNQVDYSTLNLYIQEVEEYTEELPKHRTYWQQIGDGLQGTIKGIGQFFMDLFKWFVVSLPVLALLAVIVVIILVIFRKKIFRRKKKDMKNNDDLQ